MSAARRKPSDAIGRALRTRRVGRAHHGNCLPSQRTEKPVTKPVSSPTSARLISDKREVGSSNLPRPTVESRCPYCTYVWQGLRFSACQFLCCQLMLSIKPRNGSLHRCPHVFYIHLVVDVAQGLELSTRELLLDFTRQQPEGWVPHAFAFLCVEPHTPKALLPYWPLSLRQRFQQLCLCPAEPGLEGVAWCGFTRSAGRGEDRSCTDAPERWGWPPSTSVDRANFGLARLRDLPGEGVSSTLLRLSIGGGFPDGSPLP